MIKNELIVYLVFLHNSMPKKEKQEALRPFNVASGRDLVSMEIDQDQRNSNPLCNFLGFLYQAMHLAAGNRRFY